MYLRVFFKKFVFFSYLLLSVTVLEAKSYRIGEKIELRLDTDHKLVQLIYQLPDKADGAERINARVGLNGWNKVGDISYTKTYDVGNWDYYFDIPLKVGPGGKEAKGSFKLPPRLGLVTAAIYWDKNGNREWDNNKGSNFNFPIRFPYMGPWLSWGLGAKPGSSLVVSFKHSEPTAASLRWGFTEELKNSLASNASKKVHHFFIEGLKDKAKLYYQIVLPTGESSKLYSVENLLVDGNGERFNFIVLGDTQDNGDNRRWSDVVQDISTHFQRLSFLMIVGDITFDDHEHHWWTFFDKARGLLNHVPILVVAGNHDTPTQSSNKDLTSFSTYFPYGDNPSLPYYHVRYGYADLYGLNSEDSDSMNSGGEQYEWFRDKLWFQDNLKSWSFAFWHKPPFTLGVRHWQEQFEMRAASILTNGAIDWHFSGHEHLYQRFKPMSSTYEGPILKSEYGRHHPDGGTGFIVTPPAGNFPSRSTVSKETAGSLYPLLAYPAIAGNNRVRSSQIGYLTVRLNGKEIEITAIGLGTIKKPRERNVVDRIIYRKKPNSN